MSDPTHSDGMCTRPSLPHLTPVFLILGTLAAFGIVRAAPALLRSRHDRERLPERAQATASLHTYLRDHLSGADAAITVVERLSEAHTATQEPVIPLFAHLHAEFVEEREVVVRLLEATGGSPWSVKRLIGRATGEVLQAAAGGQQGDLALFRTLESLAIGVQGKRCMWRALQHITPSLPAPADCTFRDLETLAVDQWRRIDEHRQSLIASTFG